LLSLARRLAISAAQVDRMASWEFCLLRKHNIQILKADGSTHHWVSAVEAELMAACGEIKRISRRKDPQVKYELIETEDEKGLDARTGLPRQAPGSRVYYIAVDACPAKVQGGLCTGS
jgi:hypothetical protein